MVYYLDLLKKLDSDAISNDEKIDILLEGALCISRNISHLKICLAYSAKNKNLDDIESILSTLPLLENAKNIIYMSFDRAIEARDNKSPKGIYSLIDI